MKSNFLKLVVFTIPKNLFLYVSLKNKIYCTTYDKININIKTFIIFILDKKRIIFTLSFFKLTISFYFIPLNTAVSEPKTLLFPYIDIPALANDSITSNSFNFNIAG